MYVYNYYNVKCFVKTLKGYSPPTVIASLNISCFTWDIGTDFRHVVQNK